MKGLRVKIIFLALALLLTGGYSAKADVVLTDLNSVVSIDPSSSWGMHTWTVDGVDQMYQQWFWYRIGAAGGSLPLTPWASQGPRLTRRLRGSAAHQQASSRLISCTPLPVAPLEALGQTWRKQSGS